MVRYGESQDNSSSRLKTRGLQGHDSAKLASINNPELRVIGGNDNPVPEATAILVKNLKAVRKFPS